MKRKNYGLLLAVALWPVIVGAQLFYESTPNLPIPDDSCLDPVNGHGEGGVIDPILLPLGVIASIPPTIQVQIDHTWRSDLQIAVFAVPATPGGVPIPANLLPLGLAASAPPILLANGHDGSGDNYYAHFRDDATLDCKSASACGNGANCTGPSYLDCRSDQPLFPLLGPASATPQLVFLRICDRDPVITGTLRRWRIYAQHFIPVELQSFSVD